MTATPGERPGRSVRKPRRWDGPGAVPIRTKAVKGVGRHSARLYCPTCGHVRTRCICGGDAGRG